VPLDKRWKLRTMGDKVGPWARVIIVSLVDQVAT
jgi:hypothetical protein